MRKIYIVFIGLIAHIGVDDAKYLAAVVNAPGHAAVMLLASSPPVSLEGVGTLRVAGTRDGRARPTTNFNVGVPKLKRDELTKSDIQDEVLLGHPTAGVHAYFMFPRDARVEAQPDRRNLFVAEQFTHLARLPRERRCIASATMLEVEVSVAPNAPVVIEKEDGKEFATIPADEQFVVIANTYEPGSDSGESAVAEHGPSHSRHYGKLLKNKDDIFDIDELSAVCKQDIVDKTSLPALPPWVIKMLSAADAAPPHHRAAPPLSRTDARATRNNHVVTTDVECGNNQWP